MQDALAFGGACISLLNHADRVKSACLAQLVNAIAPIMTETGGAAWRQTIFFPFADMSNLGRGRVLRSTIASPTYTATYYDPRGASELYFPINTVPYIKFAAVHDHDGGHVTLFSVNRHLDEPMRLEIVAHGFDGAGVAMASQLHHADLNAANTGNRPDEVKPTSLDNVEIRNNRITATLAPASWNVIRLTVPRA